MQSPRRVAVGSVSKGVAGIGASKGIVTLGLAEPDDVAREEWRVVDGANTGELFNSCEFLNFASLMFLE